MNNETLRVENLTGFTAMKRQEQLGILVLDGSGSMSEQGMSGQSKGSEVNTAVRDLITRLQVSSRANEISLAIVSFCNIVNKDRLPPTEVAQCDPIGNYDPNHGHGGSTAIGDALLAAYAVAEAFLAGKKEYPRDAVIVLMTDGGQTAGEGADPRTVVKQIKGDGRIQIAACAFGKAADAALMKELATNDLYLHAYNLDQLKRFFLASLTVATNAARA